MSQGIALRICNLHSYRRYRLNERIAITAAKTETRERGNGEGESGKKEGGGRLAFQQDERRFLSAKHRLRVRLLHPLSWNAPKIDRDSGRHFAADSFRRRRLLPNRDREPRRDCNGATKFLRDIVDVL